MSVNIGVLVTTFAIIALAELPDKSMVATVVLASRYPSRWVWAGASAAFVAQVVIAVLAGHLLSLAPHAVVDGIAAALFGAAAALMLFAPPFVQGDVSPAGVRTSDAARPAPVIGRSFVIVFIGELGDVTQITTADLTARYHAPLAVGIGAALGLSAVAGIAVTAGRLLPLLGPADLVRRVAGVSLLILAVLSVASALR